MPAVTMLPTIHHPSQVSISPWGSSEMIPVTWPIPGGGESVPAGLDGGFPRSDTRFLPSNPARSGLRSPFVYAPSMRSLYAIVILVTLRPPRGVYTAPLRHIESGICRENPTGQTSFTFAKWTLDHESTVTETVQFVLFCIKARTGPTGGIRPIDRLRSMDSRTPESTSR